MNKTYVREYRRMLSNAAIHCGKESLTDASGYLPYLIGNGSFGGCLDRLGMMNSLYILQMHFGLFGSVGRFEPPHTFRSLPENFFTQNLFTKVINATMIWTDSD